MRADLFDETATIKIEKGNKKPILFNQKSGFGKLSEEILELSLIEACYLMENGRIDIYKNDEKCKLSYILDILRNNNLYGKYIVYRDLKNRGYIIKTGFKYGSEFRLYKRGSEPGQGHSDYLVKVLYESYDVNILDFSSYIRVAHGVNKKLLIATVDDDLDITYYSVEWTRP